MYIQLIKDYDEPIWIVTDKPIDVQRFSNIVKGITTDLKRTGVTVTDDMILHYLSHSIRAEIGGNCVVVGSIPLAVNPAGDIIDTLPAPYVERYQDLYLNPDLQVIGNQEQREAQIQKVEDKIVNKIEQTKFKVEELTQKKRPDFKLEPVTKFAIEPVQEFKLEPVGKQSFKIERIIPTTHVPTVK